MADDVETLRAAAKSLREHTYPAGLVMNDGLLSQEFADALADWLEVHSGAVAYLRERFEGKSSVDYHPVAVARAVLGVAS